MTDGSSPHHIQLIHHPGIPFKTSSLFDSFTVCIISDRVNVYCKRSKFQLIAIDETVFKANSAVERNEHSIILKNPGRGSFKIFTSSPERLPAP